MSQKPGLMRSSNLSDRHLLPGMRVTTSVPGAGLARQLTDRKEAGGRTPETRRVTCHLPGFQKQPNIRIFCQPQEGQIPSWRLLP